MAMFGACSGMGKNIRSLYFVNTIYNLRAITVQSISRFTIYGLESTVTYELRLFFI